MMLRSITVEFSAYNQLREIISDSLWISMESPSLWPDLSLVSIIGREWGQLVMGRDWRRGRK